MRIHLLNLYYFLTMTILSSILVSCSPSNQEQIQTVMAPVVSTALSDAGNYTNTQAVEIRDTAIAYVGTESGNLQKTALAAVGTQAATLLTPQPPKINYEFNSRDIILYNVIEEIALSEVSNLYSISTDQIIALNNERYSSITNKQSILQPGWRLVLYNGSPEYSDLIPNNNDAWKDIAGCVQTEFPKISVITCNEFILDFSSELGLNFGCFQRKSNPFAYYYVHSKYQGQILYYSGVPFIYGLYYDEVKRVFLMGPAIISYKQSLPGCGIPGNP